MRLTKLVGVAVVLCAAFVIGCWYDVRDPYDPGGFYCESNEDCADTHICLYNACPFLPNEGCNVCVETCDAPWTPNQCSEGGWECADIEEAGFDVNREDRDPGELIGVCMNPDPDQQAACCETDGAGGGGGGPECGNYVAEPDEDCDPPGDFPVGDCEMNCGIITADLFPTCAHDCTFDCSTCEGG